MSKPQCRILSGTELTVPVLTFGGNVFGWTVDKPGAFTLLDALVEKGLWFIDTADCYSCWVEGNHGGESETIIGSWIKSSGKRDKIILATKVGMDMGEGKTGLGSNYIRQSVEGSLRRLQTDYIDLYQAHRDDTSTPLEETLMTFDALIKEGKVRAIGASNYSASRLQEALKISDENGLARYQTLQPQYNLYDREEYETTLSSVVNSQNLGVINYHSLAAGFLSGKYRTPADASKSQRGQMVTERYLNSRGLRIIDALGDIARARQATSAQVALS